MKKPPFQFGLKAVFAVMTGAAVLMAVAVIVPELVAWVIMASVIATVIFVVFVVGMLTFWIALLIVGDVIIRLLDPPTEPPDDLVAS